MKKPTYKHIQAVENAVRFLKPVINRLTDTRHRDDVKNDIRLLKEVRNMLHEQIVNPALPFTIPDETPAHNTLNRGERPMSNKLQDAICEVD